MKDIYWTVCYPGAQYSVHNLLHSEPTPLLKELRSQQQGLDLTHANYMKCPAFLDASANVFVMRSALHVNAAARGAWVALDQESQESVKLIHDRPFTRVGYRVISYSLHPVFFCAEPLMMASLPAYMHHGEAQTKMRLIPGAFDIGKWYRPLDTAYELNPGTEQFCFRVGDPMFYVKFFTDEPVRLIRYQFNQELQSLTVGCARYSVFQPSQPLKKLYSAFEQAEVRSHLLQLIKENLVSEPETASESERSRQP